MDNKVLVDALAKQAVLFVVTMFIGALAAGLSQPQSLEELLLLMVPLILFGLSLGFLSIDEIHGI